MKGKLPSLDPPTRFYFLAGSPCYLLFFVSQASSVIWVHFIFIDIHRDLCLCTSFLVRIAGGGAAPSPLHPPTRFYFLIGFPCYLLFFLFFISIIGYLGSFYLYWYPSRFVPMYFFLGTHCGGRRCALPPAPPHPLLFLIDFPCYLLSFVFFSYVSFLWVHLLFLNLYLYPSRLEPVCFFLGTHCGGRRCALPPAPPHPLLFFNQLPLLPTLFLFFSQASFIWVYFLYNQYFHSCCYYYYWYYYYYYCYYYY